MRLILKAVSVNPFPLHQQFSISYPGLFAPQKIWRSSGNDFTDSFYANVMLTKFLKELKVTSFVGWVELDSYSFSFLTKRRRQILCWYIFQILPKISTHTQLFKLCNPVQTFAIFLQFSKLSQLNEFVPKPLPRFHSSPVSWWRRRR